MQKLAQSNLDARLSEFPEWSLIGDSMQRTFGFDNFLDAMSFVDRVAVVAEQHQHHPDILIRYNKVTLTLTTHDAGGLTEKDLDLAGVIDEIKISKPRRINA